MKVHGHPERVFVTKKDIQGMISWFMAGQPTPPPSWYSPQKLGVYNQGKNQPWDSIPLP